MAPKICPHCQRHHPPTQLICPQTHGVLDLAGRELDGRYRFKERIGQSDCAQVWRARHLKTKRRVAVKLLRPECLDDLALVSRLSQEGVLGARVHSDQVVSIYDQGQSCIGPYVVMEWVQGESLQARLEQDHAQSGPWPLAQILTFAQGLARAMVAMHKAAVVHRDLKPSNLMVMGSGAELRVKVIDFGVAKGLLDAGTTAVGRSLGTASYMPPEQAQDAASVDERADLYAFGVIFNQLLAGQDAPVPADGDRGHLEGLSSPWQSLATDLVASDPMRRPASASVVLQRLGALETPAALGRVSPRRVRHWPWIVSAAAGVGLGLNLSPARRAPEVQRSAETARLAGSPSNSWDAPWDAPWDATPREPPLCLAVDAGPGVETSAEPAPSFDRAFGASPSAKYRRQKLEQGHTDAAELSPEPAGIAEDRALRRGQLANTESDPGRQRSGSVSSEGASGALSEGAVVSEEASGTVVSESAFGSASEAASGGAFGGESGGASEAASRVKPAGFFEQAGPDVPRRAGLIGAGQDLWTMSKRSAPMGFFDARQYCQSLSHKKARGLSSWRLASPQELGAWRDVQGIRKGWYWADELLSGKAVVVALPSNRRFLARVRRRFIRPFCVANGRERD